MMIEKSRVALTDSEGRFVMTGLPAGQMSVTASLRGFSTARYAVNLDQRARALNIQLRVGDLSETVVVTGEAALVDVQRTARSKIESQTSQTVAPSQNVINLQQRTTGVLPVRIDVPRAGTSHQFVKPLVVDQETTVRLRYKRR